MLNNILYKRTVSFTLLLVVFLTLIFVPKRPALAAFEASHISVRSYSNADWVDRFSGGDSLFVVTAPALVARFDAEEDSGNGLFVETTPAFAARFDAEAGSGTAASYPYWLFGYATNEMATPVTLAPQYAPPGWEIHLSQ
jgi:hypothetical protein